MFHCIRTCVLHDFSVFCKGGSRGVGHSFTYLTYGNYGWVNFSEFPFKDVVETAHLDDNRNNNNIHIHRMWTNNCFLIEITLIIIPCQMVLKNSTKMMTHHCNLTKLSLFKIMCQCCILTFVVQNTRWTSSCIMLIIWICISETLATKHNEHLFKHF